MWIASPGVDVQPLVAAPRIKRADLRQRVRSSVGERLKTTPGRLVVVAIVVVVVTACFGVAIAGAERSRQQAAETVRTQTEPLLVEAVNLYASLSDANATATTTFLTGGLEPASRRARYVADLRVATGSLSTLTREVGGSVDARRAVAAIADQLPVYSGLVESARANNRQGFPVGAAYLRAASTVLTRDILPAADQLYGVEAQRLNDGYRSGTQTSTLIVFAVAAAIALFLVIVAQIYLASVSRRILNLPVLAASAVLTVVSIWGLLALVGEQNALATAQRNGSDPVEVLSATRVLASRAQSDESLTLVNRGSDEQDPADFAVVLPALGRLVGETAQLDQRNGANGAAGTLTSAFAAYRSDHARIAGLEGSGRIPDAISAAVASASGPRAPADRVSANLIGEITIAQRRFEHSAGDATSALSGLSLAIPALTILSAALAVFGLRQRIGEYR